MEDKIMRVVHLASGDLWAGAEAQLYNLALQLRDHTQLHVILLNNDVLSTKLTEAGVEVTVFDERQHNFFTLLTKIIRLLRSIKPDILHTHRRKENILGAVAAFICRTHCLRTLHGVPEQGAPVWKLKQSLPAAIESFLIRHFMSVTVVPTQELVSYVTARKGSHRVEAIENGIDIDRVVELSNSGDNLPEISATGPKIAFVGRLVPVKRPDIFIQMACRIINSSAFGGRAAFFILGDGPLRIELEANIKKLKLDEKVTFLGHREDIYPIMKQMDAIVLCSDGEGLPMILLESMVLKIPIIAHAVGAIPGLLAHGRAGSLVTKHDPEGYATAVTESLQSKDLKKKTEEAERRVRVNYSIEKCSEKYVAIYDRLIIEM